MQRDPLVLVVRISALPSPFWCHRWIQRELFKIIPNGGKGDCGPAALWSLIYGGRPSSRDLKEMRNQAVDQVIAS